MLYDICQYCLRSRGLLPPKIRDRTGFGGSKRYEVPRAVQYLLTLIHSNASQAIGENAEVHILAHTTPVLHNNKLCW